MEDLRQNGTNMIVVDYSDLTSEEIEEYKNLNIPIMIILKASQQSKYNELKVVQSYI